MVVVVKIYEVGVVGKMYRILFGFFGVFQA